MPKKNTQPQAATDAAPQKIEKYLVTRTDGSAPTSVIYATSPGEACKKWGKRFSLEAADAKAENVSPRDKE